MEDVFWGPGYHIMKSDTIEHACHSLLNETALTVFKVINFLLYRYIEKQQHLWKTGTLDFSAFLQLTYKFIRRSCLHSELELLNISPVRFILISTQILSINFMISAFIEILILSIVRERQIWSTYFRHTDYVFDDRCRSLCLIQHKITKLTWIQYPFWGEIFRDWKCKEGSILRGNQKLRNTVEIIS